MLLLWKKFVFPLLEGQYCTHWRLLCECDTKQASVRSVRENDMVIINHTLIMFNTLYNFVLDPLFVNFSQNLFFVSLFLLVNVSWSFSKLRSLKSTRFDLVVRNPNGKAHPGCDEPDTAITSFFRNSHISKLNHFKIRCRGSNYGSS
jgi:hypothetical protein